MSTARPFDRSATSIGTSTLIDARPAHAIARRTWLASVLLVAIGSAAPLAQAPATALAPAPAVVAQGNACALAWLSREADYEQFLRSAQVTGMKDVPVGVTRPRRAYFAPGGLAESMAWKPIAPGMRGGFWESYKSEIAAYELDKLLKLQMVPPTVEKRIDGTAGAAVLWVSPTKSFKELGGVPGQRGVAGPPGAAVAGWTRQVVRAKMFDNLIANKDPNLGNWLVDGDWHLLVIDHSRSFTTSKSMVHKMDNIDQELWDRFQALDEATLQQSLGDWLTRGEIRAILDRREVMRKEIAKMVAERGNSVFLR
jgi:hypothetical protein